MSGDGKGSGEVSSIMIGLLQEVRTDCKTLTAGQAQVQRTLDAGERRMDDLDKRLSAVEKNGCQRLAQHQQAMKPERSQRDIPTDRITKKPDLTQWIKYGAMIGAAVAGAYAAVKAGGSP